MRNLPTLAHRGLMPLLFAAAAAPRPALADGPQRPDLDSPATIAAGAKRFNQNCVYCHGNAGSGGKGAALQGRHDLTPEYLFQTISNGKQRGSLLMPAWKEAFSEREIWELGGYILSLRDVGPKK